MIDLSHLKGRRYGVFGLGRTGMAAVRALIAGGAEVIAWDDNSDLLETASREGAETGNFMTAPLAYLEAIVWSPGAPFLAPKPLPAASAARRQGVPLISDVQLLLDAKHGARVIGVTGSNGKSTTTALIGHILQRSGRKVAVGGNLGPPALGLNHLSADGIYVLELSSYQLELTPSPNFDISIFLNLEPDHLDRHSGLHNYAAQKRRIFIGSKSAIIGTDDPHGRWLLERCKKDFPSTEISTNHLLDKGVSINNGWLCEDEQPVFAFNSAKSLNGKHNQQNAAAAYAAARNLGLSTDEIIPSLENFDGLPHRQALIRNIDRITYINDSKATNSAAAARALSSFGRTFWIAGGLPKDGGLKGIEECLKNVVKAYFFGQAGNSFKNQLSQMAPSIPASEYDTMDEALAAAHNDAHRDFEDSVILLSPACASFDQFNSYEHRGDVFTDLVSKLEAPRSNGAAA